MMLKIEKTSSIQAVEPQKELLALRGSDDVFLLKA